MPGSSDKVWAGALSSWNMQVSGRCLVMTMQEDHLKFTKNYFNILNAYIVYRMSHAYIDISFDVNSSKLCDGLAHVHKYSFLHSWNFLRLLGAIAKAWELQHLLRMFDGLIVCADANDYWRHLKWRSNLGMTAISCQLGFRFQSDFDACWPSRKNWWK